MHEGMDEEDVDDDRRIQAEPPERHGHVLRALRVSGQCEQCGEDDGEADHEQGVARTEQALELRQQRPVVSLHPASMSMRRVRKLSNRSMEASPGAGSALGWATRAATPMLDAGRVARIVDRGRQPTAGPGALLREVRLAQASAVIICRRGSRVNASAARKAPMPSANAPMKSQA